MGYLNRERNTEFPWVDISHMIYIYICIPHTLPWALSWFYGVWNCWEFSTNNLPFDGLVKLPKWSLRYWLVQRATWIHWSSVFLVVRFFLYFLIFKTWCFGTFWHVVVVFQLMLFSRMYLLLFCYYELWWWSSSSYLRPKSFNLTSRLLLTYLPNQSHEIIAGNRETFPKGWRSLGRCRVGFLTRYK